MLEYFRCSRTGMLYPPDYIEQWGRKYGIGLGCTPVSEALVNVYTSPLVANEAHPELTMYPVSNCFAQVDFVILDKEPPADRIPILAIDDPNMQARAEIMRSRQRVHSAEMSRIWDSVN